MWPGRSWALGGFPGIRPRAVAMSAPERTENAAWLPAAVAGRTGFRDRSQGRRGILQRRGSAHPQPAGHSRAEYDRKPSASGAPRVPSGTRVSAEKVASLPQIGQGLLPIADARAALGPA